MSRPVVRIAVATLAVVAIVIGLAADDPALRPQAERLIVLAIAGAVVAGVALALARAHPPAAVTAFDRPVTGPVDRPPLPSELRWIAGTFTAPTGFSARRLPAVGGRNAIQRLGRERLRARGLDLDRPEHIAVARRLTGEHLWAIVATPPDVPLPGIDVDDALTHLEAL